MLKNNKNVLTKDVEPAKEIINALCDDINTPEAFGQLNILFNQLQNAQDDRKGDLISQIHSSANLLGILKKDPEEWLGYKNQTKDFDVATIEELINKRNAFRIEKNYQRSDQIRDELKSLGVEIEDTPDGTIWRKS
jgi:cysteinyl-tRNA synthetase